MLSFRKTFYASFGCTAKLPRRSFIKYTLNILWAENTESIGQAFKSLTGQTSGLPVCSYWFKVENKDEWPDRVLFLDSNKKNQTFGYIQELTNSVNLSLSKNAVSLRGDDVFLECFLNVQQNYVTEIISAMQGLNTLGVCGNSL